MQDKGEGWLAGRHSKADVVPQGVDKARDSMHIF
jgi:hypothetical protein